MKREKSKILKAEKDETYAEKYFEQSLDYC